jgi:SAM-dependent methyltransferase
MRKDLHEQNRRSWNHATVAHNSHKGDQAAFLRGGGTTLDGEERELLGDVRGLRVVHLLCNSGQDSLSIAALGAADVIGVDISDEAIAFASRLSAESGIAARFDRADVYDWLAAAPAGSADVVYASYGALCWLSDLPTWAAGVARLLAPGGRLVVMEFHPALYLFEERDGALVLSAPRADRVWHEAAGIGDYVAASAEGLTPGRFEAGVEDFRNPEPSAEFDWTLGEIVGAIAGAGLAIERLSEWPHCNGCRIFSQMVDAGDDRWVMPAGFPRIPLMFGLVARRA